jgi:hypothetical protein
MDESAITLASQLVENGRVNDVLDRIDAGVWPREVLAEAIRRATGAEPVRQREGRR